VLQPMAEFMTEWLGARGRRLELVADGGDDGANAIFTIVLATILLDYLLTLVSSLLNYRALSTAMPLEFEGVYEPQAYSDSQRYTKAKTIFSLLHTTFDLLVMLAFWLAFDGFELIDSLVRSWAPGDAKANPMLDIGRGLLYMAVLSLAEGLLGVPWEIYFTFVLEERFGFNKTTARTFVMDKLKGLALMLALGVPLMGAILAFFIYAGEAAWYLCWGFMAAFQILIMFVAPIWIFPLFNEFTPLPDGELKDAIDKYAAGVGFKYGGIYQIDGSKRSAHSNAFFTGFGKTKRIALFDTLVAQMSTTELLGVLAHEVGHEKRGHIVQGIVVSLLYTFVLLYIMSLFLSFPPLFAAFSVSHVSVYVGLVLFQLLFSPVDTFMQIGMTMRSRSNEFEADRYSVDTYGEPEALVNALKKLSRENLANLTPHPLHVFLTYSHPPVLERVAAIRAAQASGGRNLL